MTKEKQEAHEEEVRRATEAYDKALNTLHRSASSGCPGKAGGGQEAKLGQAYSWLVRLGVKPRLKGKYRG